MVRNYNGNCPKACYSVHTRMWGPDLGKHFTLPPTDRRKGFPFHVSRATNLHSPIHILPGKLILVILLRFSSPLS
jgi:hypothetical protein